MATHQAHETPVSWCDESGYQRRVEKLSTVFSNPDPTGLRPGRAAGACRLAAGLAFANETSAAAKPGRVPNSDPAPRHRRESTIVPGRIALALIRSFLLRRRAPRAPSPTGATAVLARQEDRAGSRSPVG